MAQYNNRIYTAYILKFLQTNAELIHISNLEQKAGIREGTLKRAIARESKSLKPETLRNLLPVLTKSFNFQLPTFETAIETLYGVVGRICGVTVNGLKSRVRDRQVVEARYIAIDIYAKITFKDTPLGDKEYTYIADRFNYDRNTIRHALNTVTNLLETNLPFKTKYNLCLEQFNI